MFIFMSVLDGRRQKADMTADLTDVGGVWVDIETVERGVCREKVREPNMWYDLRVFLECLFQTHIYKVGAIYTIYNLMA